ncbi:MAG: hypothetical protein MJ245_07395 [Clostridia bacterium]|nr:hypothetical protein [Clostridia bacterium]
MEINITISGLTLTIGIVKLFKDYYVLLTPSFIEFPDRDRHVDIDIDKADIVYQDACNMLWGEGTALKTLKVSQGTDNYDEIFNTFGEQISCYEDTCLLNNEESLIDYHERGEMMMEAMGLPICFGYTQKKLCEDIVFVMKADHFVNKIMPKINEKYANIPNRFVYETFDNVVMSISEIVSHSKE